MPGKAARTAVRPRRIACPGGTCARGGALEEPWQVWRHHSGAAAARYGEWTNTGLW